MKTNFLKLTLLALVLFTASCSNDDDKTPEAVTATATNIPAPQTGGQGQPVAESGAFTKFSFSENKVVTTDKWDIAFRGTKILVNGGAKIGITDEPEKTGQAAVSVVLGTFASVTAIPDATTFKQDAAAVYAFPAVSGQGWYNYNDATRIITPIAGKVYVIKTHDGKYAKVEFLNYYKDAPAIPSATSEGRFYTFNFVYQANSTTTF